MTCLDELFVVKLSETVVFMMDSWNLGIEIMKPAFVFKDSSLWHRSELKKYSRDIINICPLMFWKGEFLGSGLYQQYLHRC